MASIDSKKIERVMAIYNDLLSQLDSVLIGVKKEKRAIAAAILCDPNSRLLLSGTTGMGKTSIAKSLASNFNSERISIFSDMLPDEILSRLKKKNEFEFLLIDEFNRANGRVQSAFIELFEENQITDINGEATTFPPFYVIADQNDKDISGVFQVPQAVYDRFDMKINFEALSAEEKQKILFGNFKPSTQSHLSKEDIQFTSNMVSEFPINEKDQELMMNILKRIWSMTIHGESIFASSNIRADLFAIKLVKLIAMTNGRDYLLPSDISEFVKYIYQHRVAQNIDGMSQKNIETAFSIVEEEINSLKRTRTFYGKR